MQWRDEKMQANDRLSADWIPYTLTRRRRVGYSQTTTSGCRSVILLQRSKNHHYPEEIRFMNRPVPSFTRLAKTAAFCATLLAGLYSNATLAQGKPLTKVRYEEVVRSILYVPKYVALSKGYFKEAGLDVTMKTSQGTDKGMAALLSNSADIVLIGPEAAIYVFNSESPVKPKIFAGLTATDGFMLMSRKKVDNFDWKMLKGKDVLGFRPGSAPILFFEAAMKKNGIDPQKDVKLANNIAIPARMGSWLAGQNEYGIFLEPEASMLEKDGKAHPVLSVGNEVGFIDYTVFMATDTYIKQNPETVQAWTNAIAKAQKYTETAPTAELVKILAEYFPGMEAQMIGAAVERYRKYHIWKAKPMVEPQAIDKLQDLLVMGGVLDKGKRVKYDNVVIPDFAKKAQ